MNSLKKYSFNAFPAKRILRRMGLFHDQDGIMRRYIVEQENWKQHLDFCTHFIEQAVSRLSPARVAVLGSGWLLDVPLEFLSQHCKEVHLYDIRHPRPVAHKMKQYRNVELFEMDITGGMIEYIYSRVRTSGEIPNGNFPEILFSPVKQVDLIVSLNILNQLDCLIADYLKSRYSLKETALIELRKKIQQNHLNSLPADRSVLISDYEEQRYDRTGELKSTHPLLFVDFPEGNFSMEWGWKFDNHMTYHPNRITHLKVKAIQI
ncbi:MAG: hypothetical protein IPM71_04965 [Bacteroidota bacterium]|nr:MAG: hypothetical protein IPM71_04965 [Bacteroidota bacterium]